MSHAFRRVALTTILAGACLALAGGTVAARPAPPLTIDGVAIDDGVAVVTGAVADPQSSLEANGAPVTVEDSGAFVTSVDLGLTRALVLSLAGAPGETITIRIPVAVLSSNSGNGILDDLVDAGIAIDVPVEGFRIVDGQMPRIDGSVLNGSKLTALEVNGVDVLDDLGSDGAFSILAPRSPASHSVNVVAVDRQGLSQKTSFRTTTVRSVIRTRAGTSVSAAGARGLVITKLRFDKSRLLKTRHLRVVVTVKDRRGYLVRGASMRLVATPRNRIADGSMRTGFTNGLGKTSITYRLCATALAGTRPYLVLAATASTPTAIATRKAAVLLRSTSGN